MATACLLTAQKDSPVRACKKLVYPMNGTNFHGHSFHTAIVPSGTTLLSKNGRLIDGKIASDTIIQIRVSCYSDVNNLQIQFS
jgi:hypothetical protein